MTPTTPHIRWTPCAAAALALAALAGLAARGAQASPPVPLGDEVAHIVKEGDTLEGLARDYLAAPRQWQQLQTRNKVADPRRLQPGSVIWIPVRLQPSESATVQFVQGAVTAQARVHRLPAPPRLPSCACARRPGRTVARP